MELWLLQLSFPDFLSSRVRARYSAKRGKAPITEKSSMNLGSLSNQLSRQPSRALPVWQAAFPAKLVQTEMEGLDYEIECSQNPA
jgi:hypothetical protein